MLPTETFGDSEDRDSIVLVPEELQEEFPPRFDPKYPGKALWPDLLISPSQVTTYTACSRKWGWNKLEGQKEPEKPGQTTGKRYHKALEDWLSKVDVPKKEEDRVLPALTHFPEPHTPGMSVERYFAMLVDDVVFHGFTDVDVSSSQALEVYDLKTTKDLCWAKTPKMLLGDPQASVYALKQMVEADEPYCTTRWVYCLTEGKRAAVPVDLGWTFDKAFEVVQGWLPFARAMVAAHREKKKAVDLGFNAGHCGAYGGCHYQGMCQISAKDRMIAMFRQEKLENTRRETVGMTLKEKMAQDLAKKGQALPPTGGVVPVQKTAAAAPKAPVVEEKPAATSTIKKPSLAEVAKSMADNKPVKLSTGINPPDASPDPRQVDIEEVIAKADSGSQLEDSLASAPVEAPKKTRKTKSEAETPASKPENQGFGFFLLVDALIEKGASLRRVDDLIRPVREELEQKTQCVHYLTIDYGKGPAMLAAGLREAFQTNKPSGVFTVDSRAVDAAVLTVLAEFADNIVRGVR
jgi:hypothetical protein